MSNNTLANIAVLNRDGTDFSDLGANLEIEQTVEEGAAVAKAFNAFYGVHQTPTGPICPKCKGKGRFIRSGRDLGPCFSCDGTGAVSPEKAKAMIAHEKGRVTQANNERSYHEVLNAKRRAFISANSDLLYYCSRVRNDFTDGCMRKLSEIGEMTGPQIAAIRRRLEERAAQERQQAQHVTAAAPAGSGLDLSHVPAGRYAVPNGDTRLKVQLEKPEAPSKWAGWVFISDAAEYGQGKKYGRQAPGKTYSGMIQDELRAIAADPHAAAVAYGKLTGTCAMCGRRLENEESVARGIGPICAAKQGWG